jgi:hypothetical protein
MTFRLWPIKPDAPCVPPLVALGPECIESLRSAANELRIPLVSQIPSSGDYVLALIPPSPIPPDTPAHIPVIDATAPDLVHRIEAALLYIQAHHKIKQ